MARDWHRGSVEPTISELAATPRLLVALDFDGTVSPLVTEPMEARALPEATAQIVRLAALPDTLVAYVSGRSMRDLRVIAQHSDDSPVALAGSHGAEYWYPGTGAQSVELGEIRDRATADVLAAAEAAVERFPSVVLERKTFGFGVHTRRASDETERAVFAAIDALAEEAFPTWRRREGNRILEFSWRREGKDFAIRTLRDHFEATGSLFAGDDVTDEDALRELGSTDVGVRVGPGESVAALRVGRPHELAELLEALANERAARRQ